MSLLDDDTGMTNMGSCCAYWCGSCVGATVIMLVAVGFAHWIRG